MADLLDHLRLPHQRKALLREVARKAANEGDWPTYCEAVGYKPHPGQHRYHAARATHTRRVIVSGRRFGKTLGMGQEASFKVLRDGTRVLVCTPTAELGERLFRVMRNTLCRQLQFSPTRMADSPVRRELHFEWGSSLVIRSAMAEESLLGDAWDAVFIDEAARVAEHIWTNEIEPGCADLDASVTFASTPRGFGWFKSLVSRGDDPEQTEWHVTRGTTEDNPAIGRRWLARRKREVSPEVYRREYCGEFVSLEGSVYPEWSEDIHVTTQAEFDPRLPFRLAFDFGTTSSSPFVCLVCQWEADLQRLRVVNELFIEGCSTTEWGERLLRWWKQWGYPTGETATSVGDISARDARLHLEAALRDTGLLAHGQVETRQQSVEDGIELVRGLLRERRVVVHPRASRTREEYASYVWRNPIREGESEPGVRKTHDHAMDSLRYLAHALASGPMYRTFAHRPGEEEPDPALRTNAQADALAREAHRHTLAHPERRGPIPDLGAVMSIPSELGRACRRRALPEDGRLRMTCPLCDQALGIVPGSTHFSAAWHRAGCGREIGLTIIGDTWQVKLGRERVTSATA